MKSFFAILILFFIGLGSVGFAAVDKRIVEERAATFVTVFNSQSEERISEFIEAYWIGGEEPAVVERAAMFLEIVFKDYGSIEKYQTKVINNQAFHIIGKMSRTGKWMSFQFGLSEDGAYRILLGFFGIAVEPTFFPKGKIDSEEILERLDSLIVQLKTEEPFYGNVLIARGDKPFYVRSEGLADVENNIPITINSRFGMASGGKMFTAVAIIKLLEKGSINLDDTLAKHLPDFPDQNFANTTTIRELLSHIGGAGDYWDAAYEKVAGDFKIHNDYLPHIIRNLNPKTKGQFEYSNSGFLLLGLIIEAVSGKEYFEFLEEVLFTPLGMENTGPYKPGDPNYVKSYQALDENGNRDSMSTKLFKPYGISSSAGGAYTTVHDIFAFGRALLGDSFLSPELKEILMEPKVTFPGATNLFYGSGFIINKENDLVEIGHGGRGPASQFSFNIYPEKDLIYVVVSNFDSIGAHEIDMAIKSVIREKN